MLMAFGNAIWTSVRSKVKHEHVVALLGNLNRKIFIPMNS